MVGMICWPRGGSRLVGFAVGKNGDVRVPDNPTVDISLDLLQMLGKRKQYSSVIYQWYNPQKITLNISK